MDYQVEEFFGENGYLESYIFRHCEGGTTVAIC